MSEPEGTSQQHGSRRPDVGPSAVMRVRYVRSLVLGVSGIALAVIWIANGFRLLAEEVSWNSVLGILPGLGMALIGWIFVYRSLLSLHFSAAGIRILRGGTWRLSWGEIRHAQLTDAGLIIEPTVTAQQRQLIRSAAFWSRLYAPGQQSPGAIALPMRNATTEGVAILRTHGVGLASNAKD